MRALLIACAWLSLVWTKRPVWPRADIEYDDATSSSTISSHGATSTGCPVISSTQPTTLNPTSIISVPQYNRDESEASTTFRAIRKLRQSTSQDCVMCIQSIPECHCTDPSACIFVPQSCRRCAHFTCRGECVICPQILPKCDCPADQHCVLVPQTCNECASYQCISP
jgi:hypothetical protein